MVQIQSGGTVVNYLPASARDPRDAGLIPGSGRPPGVRNGNPCQYYFLENSMGRGAWWVAVHRVTKSYTQLSTQSNEKKMGSGIKEAHITIPKILLSV